MITWRWGPSEEQVELLREFRKSSGRDRAISSSNFLEFLGRDGPPEKQHVIEFLWGYAPLYFRSHPEPFDELRHEIEDLIRFMALRGGWDPGECLEICADEDIFHQRWRGLHIDPLTLWLEELRSMLELRGLPSTIPPIDPDDAFGRRLVERIRPGLDSLLEPGLDPAGVVPASLQLNAAACPAMHYVQRLLEVVGASTLLTTKGNLNLADGKALAEATDWKHLFDERIGDRVFKTQSTSEIEPVDLTFRWAKAAGFVRTERRKLLPTKKGLRFGREVIQDWWSLFRTAALKLDWAKTRYAKDRMPFWAELVGDCTASYLRIAADVGPGGVALYPIALATWKLVEERWVTDDLSEEQIRWQESSIRSDIKRGVFLPFELLGCVETWTGAAHGAVRVSPLGRWAVSRLAQQYRQKMSQKQESFLAGVIDLRQWRLQQDGAGTSLGASSATPTYKGDEKDMTDYFDLEVSLMDVSPKVWRRFLIRASATFMDLHYAIQDACGWTNSHLFAFRTGKGETIAGLPVDEGFGDSDPDAARVRLASFFKTGGLRKCLYEYDFGDSWEHQVVLKGAVQLPDKFEQKLIDGARAFPLEDFGGLPGYEDCVRVAQGHEGETIVGDAAEVREWMGDWNPEDFDLERTQKAFDR